MASLFVCPSIQKERYMQSLQKKITAAVLIIVASHYLKKWAKS